MNNNTKSIIIGVVVAIMLFIALTVDGATNSLPKNASKFQDGDVTCYTYYKSISCLKNPLPASSKGQIGA